MMNNESMTYYSHMTTMKYLWSQDRHTSNTILKPTLLLQHYLEKVQSQKEVVDQE